MAERPILHRFPTLAARFHAKALREVAAMSHDFPDGPDYNPEPLDDDPWNVNTASYLGPCAECGEHGVDLDYTGADGRSVCDDCREAISERV